MLLIEASTAGKLRSDGSTAARPVNGLIPDGKSSSSGPYVTGGRCGWGVDVGDGVVVDVGVVTSVAVRVGVDSIAGLPPQLMRSKTLRQIEKIRLNNSQISTY